MPEDEKSQRAPTEIEGPRYSSLVEYPERAAALPLGSGGPGERLELSSELDPLTHKLEILAPQPGVYLLKDRAGKVLYVGKAKSLRPRVRAYFHGREGEQGDGRFQVRFLMKRVRD